MLEKYFTKPQTIDYIRNSWIGELIDRYVTWLDELHYSQRNVLHRVPILMQFGKFAKAKGAKSQKVLPKYVDAFIEIYTKEHSKNSKTLRAVHSVANSARTPIQQMLRLLIDDYHWKGPGGSLRRPFFKFCTLFF